MTDSKTKVTINATINAPVEKVWTVWNEPQHIMQWNSASDDWHSPRAENDLRNGGTFNYRMEARDGSFGFDFAGVYDEVVPNERISYTMGDSRTVTNIFTPKDGGTEITSTFEAESENPVEMQRDGWQAILNNFKKYTEGL